mmetsp:Transcript_18529/g.47097  ORF Transcript_18529/g.47097 Transcript_18529/m.47097 type:complete len:206 (-) Transcript_18529:931-1548(-)
MTAFATSRMACSGTEAWSVPYPERNSSRWRWVAATSAACDGVASATAWRACPLLPDFSCLNKTCSSHTSPNRRLNADVMAGTLPTAYSGDTSSPVAGSRFGAGQSGDVPSRVPERRRYSCTLRCRPVALSVPPSCFPSSSATASCCVTSAFVINGLKWRRAVHWPSPLKRRDHDPTRTRSCTVVRMDRKSRTVLRAPSAPTNTSA